MLRKRSASSRTSSIRSESELSVPLMNEDTPKTITMSQLNEMRATSNEALVTEDLDVLEDVGELKKTTWQDLEVQRRLDVERCKEKRKYEHGTVGTLHPEYVSYFCSQQRRIIFFDFHNKYFVNYLLLMMFILLSIPFIGLVQIVFRILYKEIFCFCLPFKIVFH